MKLFNLGNGLYCVQSGVILTQFGNRLLLPFAAQPDTERKSWKKIIARALCFMRQSNFRPCYFYNNDAYFLDFLCTKLPFDLF